jgi:hypothetical protein
MRKPTLPTHAAMLKGPSLDSMRTSKPELSPELQKNITQAVPDYTIESQYFHYPLRWETTGQAKHQPVVPGSDFVYNIMNKPGNTDGPSSSHRMGGEKHFDPIEASRIDINKTYDKVSLFAEAAVMIGVGDDGFYAIRSQDGKHTVIKMDGSGEGHSAGNLLHVFHRAAYAGDRQYKVATAADGSSRLTAGKAKKIRLTSC